MDLDFNEAVKLLKTAVKHSHLDNQKHIDLTLVNPDQRTHLQKALMVVQVAVKNGELTDEELKSKLGLL